MEAKEIMIGDWVMYEDHPYQIRQLGIYDEDRDGNDYPAVCIGKPQGIGLIVERNEIHPIPITTKILEMNGFRLGSDGWLWTLENGNEEQDYIFIQFRKGCKEIRKCELCFFKKAQIVFRTIQYLHQLQQAMRLCGIEKEITLN